MSGHSHGHEYEHEFEAAYGLPETLPKNEHLLWQGSPDWRRLAIEAFHVRKLAIYFALLLSMRAAFVISDGGTAAQSILAVLLLLPVAAFSLGILVLLAWLTGRNCVYTVTNRRVVMRIGIVLTITFNLPYSAIESASMRANPDGSGNVVLKPAGSDKIAYVHLWPHARPWHLKNPQPMLRAIPDVQRVATLLSAALAASAGTQPVQISATRPGERKPQSEPVDAVAA